MKHIIVIETSRKVEEQSTKDSIIACIEAFVERETGASFIMSRWNKDSAVETVKEMYNVPVEVTEGKS